MNYAAFDALSAGDKAGRAYQAVHRAMNDQALCPDPDGNGLALEHALELLARHVPASYWATVAKGRGMSAAKTLTELPAFVENQTKG